MPSTWLTVIARFFAAPGPAAYRLLGAVACRGLTLFAQIDDAAAAR
jgi:hypothetical protein